MLKSTLQHLRDAQAKELEGEGAAEAGFTLIELMVVLLIIAILLAIAIPTFLGVTSGANDRAAQSNLTNALTEAAAVYQSNSQSYGEASGTLATLMGSSAPEFTWTDGGQSLTNASTGQGIISVEPYAVASESAANDQGISLAIMSKTGTCWYAVNEQQTPTTGTAGTFYAQEAKSDGSYSAAHCTAAYGVSKLTSFASGSTLGTTYSNAPHV